MKNTNKKSVKSMYFDTIATHGIYDLNEALKNNGSIIEPLFLSPAQTFYDTDELEASLAYEIPSWSYTRIHNPTVHYLESTLALLEGYKLESNTNCCVTSSGMSAIALTIDTLLSNDNCNFLSTSNVYGGTFQQFSVQQKKKNNHVRWIDSDASLDKWESKIDKDTKFIFIEVPTNPLLKIVNIEEVAKLSNKYQIPLIVDSTIATPALIRPISLGADIVIHSLSKTIGSSGLAIGGAIISKENITAHFLSDEIKNNFTKFLKLLPNRDNGACISPMNAFLLLSDLRTLRSRVKLLSENTEKIFYYLKNHKNIEKIYYPKSNYFNNYSQNGSMFSLVDDYNTKLFGHLISFTVKGNIKEAKKVLDSFNLIFKATDLGRIKSVATIPSISTHQQQGAKGQKIASIPNNLIRLSVGAENPLDIINDLEKGLKNI